MKITAVDCNYVEKEFAASFLLHENNQGMFVECNTTHAIPFLEKAALAQGLNRESVHALLITHVHLDHAGGAGAFLKVFPHAKVYAHPRAARHLIDPSKLIASATAVYGEERMAKWYGTIYPCDASRVVVLEDGATFDFAGHSLRTKHLRGHANHHLVMIEPETQTLFSGDSFGVAYPELKHPEHDVILASTSPTDFDGEAALAAIDWIVAQKPEQIALTHFGFIPKENIAADAQTLRDQLVFSMVLMKEIVRDRLEVSEIAIKLRSFLQSYFAGRGFLLSSEHQRLLSVDIQVNAQGLHFAAQRATLTA